MTLLTLAARTIPYSIGLAAAEVTSATFCKKESLISHGLDYAHTVAVAMIGICVLNAGPLSIVGYGIVLAGHAMVKGSRILLHNKVKRLKETTIPIPKTEKAYRFYKGMDNTISLFLSLLDITRGVSIALSGGILSQRGKVIVLCANAIASIKFTRAALDR